MVDVESHGTVATVTTCIDEAGSQEKDSIRDRDLIDSIPSLERTMADIRSMLDTYEREQKKYSELLARAKAARTAREDAVRVDAARIAAREEADRVVQWYAARQDREKDSRRVAAREHEARVAREARALEADLDEIMSKVGGFGTWADHEPNHTLRAEDLRLTRYSRVRHHEIVTDTYTCMIRNVGRIMHTVLYSEPATTNALEEVVKLADEHENDDVKCDDGSYAANELSLALADEIPNGSRKTAWYVVNDRAEAPKQQWCLGSVPVSDVRRLEGLLSTECNSKIKKIEISDATHPAYMTRDETLHVNGRNVGYMTVATEDIREGDFVEFYDKHAYTFNEREASELDVSVLNDLCKYVPSSFMKVYFQMLKRIDDTSYIIDIAKGDFRMLGDRTRNCTCTINDPRGLTGEANVAPIARRIRGEVSHPERCGVVGAVRSRLLGRSRQQRLDARSQVRRPPEKNSTVSDP